MGHKFILTGDLHWRLTKPKARLDEDYLSTMAGKYNQITVLAESMGDECLGVIHPGDVFDAPGPTYGLVYAVARSLNDYEPRVPVYCVAGQHDQRWHHTNLANTPLGLLDAVGVVRMLAAAPVQPYHGMVWLYGASWGEDIPSPLPHKGVHVLVMHRMVIGNEKLWKQQQEFMWSRHVLRRHKFDLIVTGDNHQFFTDTVPGPRHLVNCGSLMRSTVAQTEHEPSVVVYDVDERTIQRVKLGVQPADNVLDFAQHEVEQERTAELNAFIETIRGTGEAVGFDYLSTLERLSRAQGVPAGVAAQVKRIVEMSHGKDA